MYLLWIVYSQIWLERMLISDNPVSLDNLHSLEKPNTPQLYVTDRSRYAKFIYQKCVLTVRQIRHVARNLTRILRTFS